MQRQAARDGLVATSAVGATAAMGAVIFTVLCAAGTTGIALVGAGGVVLASRLEWTRPYLLLGSGSLLVLGFVLAHWRHRARRAARAVLWSGTVVTIGAPIVTAWVMLR